MAPAYPVQHRGVAVRHAGHHARVTALSLDAGAAAGMPGAEPGALRSSEPVLPALHQGRPTPLVCGRLQCS